MMQITTGGVRLAYQPITNGDFEHWRYYASPNYWPDGWTLGTIGAAYEETNSLFWLPGGTTKSAVRLSISSHASAITALTQAVSSMGDGSINASIWRRVFSPGSHTVRGSAWAFLPNSENRPDMRGVSVAVSVVGLGATQTTCAMNMNSIHGWYFLETPVLNYYVGSGDLDGSLVYASLALNGAAKTIKTAWFSGARLEIDGIDLIAYGATDNAEVAALDYRCAHGAIALSAVGQSQRCELNVAMPLTERQRVLDWWNASLELMLRIGCSHDLTAWGGALASHYGVNCPGLPFPQLGMDCVLANQSFPLSGLEGPGDAYYVGALDLLGCKPPYLGAL